MMSEKFALFDEKGECLTEKTSIGKIFLWLNEEGYFRNSPEKVLELVEIHTKKEVFSASITQKTTQADINNLWKPFSEGL